MRMLAPQASMKGGESDSCALNVPNRQYMAICVPAPQTEVGARRESEAKKIIRLRACF
jgi:hypothetical protein